MTVRVKDAETHGPDKSWAFVCFEEESAAAECLDADDILSVFVPLLLLLLLLGGAVCQPRLGSYYLTDLPGASCVWGFVGASIKDDTGVEIKLEIKHDNTANELKKNKKNGTTAISHVLTHRLPGTIHKLSRSARADLCMSQRM